MNDGLIFALIAGVAALVFALLWRRAVAAQAKAEGQAAQAERDLATTRQAATRTAAYLAALQLAQTEPVLFVSPERLVSEWNVPAQALFGAQGGLGQTLFLVTRSLDLDHLILRALAGESDCDQQVLLGSGAVPYRARAIRAGAFGVALVLQDLSVLQRLGRARRDFVANLSHDLRTPLTSIRLLVESLQTGVVSAGDQASVLHKITIEIQALEQMAQELLDLAQIESGKTIVKLVSTSLAQLAAETRERLEPQARQKRQTLDVEVPPDLVVLADVERLSRALGNLVHNAIKFTPEQGHIRVRAYLHEGEALVEVSDTGPGIPPEDLPRVFERFFRGDRSRASGGTGLGLAVAKHIIEAHGGRLWAESTGQPGQGAVFRFTLLVDA